MKTSPMMRTNRVTITCVAALGILAAWTYGDEASAEPPALTAQAEGGPAVAPRDQSPVYTAEELNELVMGNSAFALDLYGRLQEGATGNLFFSPYSISQALGMTMAGARGETERQMAETMHFGLDQERLHATFNGLDRVLASRADEVSEWMEGDRFQLNVANSIWPQQGYALLQPFVDTLGRNYGIEATPVDFRSDAEAARQVINRWVSDHTAGKIPELIPMGLLTELTRLVLTNAIYFNASWQHPFGEASTREEPFHLLDGTEVLVPMMHQMERFQYASGDGYALLSVPYLGHSLSMVVLLPDQGRFEEIETGLSLERLQSILGEMRGADVALALPKFRLESDFSLAQILAELGMPIAFDRFGADFSGIATIPSPEQNLYISAVIHKAFVDVDETGTEAAAATAVIMAEAGAAPSEPPPPPIPFVADRPFILLIRDSPTGSILFMGRILDPTR